MVWMRADGALPDDPVLHQCVLTYASDMTLLDTVNLPHGKTFLSGELIMASLDHAMWFHRPFRADDWFLYVQDAPSTQGARGLARRHHLPGRATGRVGRPGRPGSTAVRPTTSNRPAWRTRSVPGLVAASVLAACGSDGDAPDGHHRNDHRRPHRWHRPRPSRHRPRPLSSPTIHRGPISALELERDRPARVADRPRGTKRDQPICTWRRNRAWSSGSP